MPDPIRLNLATLGSLTPPTNPGPGWVGPERPAESWADVRADPLSALFDVGRGALTGDAPKGRNLQGIGAMIGAALPVIRGAKALKAVTSAESEAKALANAAADEYRMAHRPPGPGYGAPLHDLTGNGEVYPDDVYSALATRYYGTGLDALDRQTFRQAQSMRGKPDRQVTIYRAVPNDPNITDIRAGDWVTINPQYAKQHGESVLDDDYKIIKKTVKASEIFTNGDSIHEWGYHPNAK